MIRRNTLLFFTLSVALLSVSAAAKEPEPLKEPTPSANPALLKHQERFSKPELIKVTETVYVAHGFDMSNIIFIVAPDGLIVMDTGFRVENAENAIKAIRKISDKPIRAVFYSHGHGDHIGGSEAFKAAAPDATFIAHKGWRRNINYVSSAVRPAFSGRAFAQLGLMLPEGLTGTVGSGGGPVLRATGRVSYVSPTRIVSDGEWLNIAGLEFQALYTPGDLDDGLSLWLPDTKTVLTGDTITDSHVHSILSTPRHEPGRDAQAFVDSMSRLEALQADNLIGGHGDVVRGQKAVQQLIRNDRRTAQFVIDEVMRHIRKGRSGEYVQSNFAYPEWFIEDEDRGDYYHRLSWIARGVYTQHMGWFNGDATGLSPVRPKVRAQHIVTGFGGEIATLEAVRIAYKNGDFAWAIELATYILAVKPTNLEARTLKSWAMKAIAYQSESANERNYLLTQSMILDGSITLATLINAQARAGLPASYAAADAKGFLHTLGARLDIEKARKTRLRFEINVTDKNESYFVEIDNGVLLTSLTQLEKTDFTLAVSHLDLALLCEGFVGFKSLLETGALQIRGNQQKFSKLSTLFN